VNRRTIATLVMVCSTIAAPQAGAAPRRVMVLPIDGDADPAVRKQLDGVVTNLAKTESGTVTNGDTTFTEAAVAVGCDPLVPACADTVLTTLGVDEIVYGNADVGGGQTTLVVTRVIKGQPRRDQTVSIAAGASAEDADPSLRPLFDLPAPVIAPPPPLEPATGSASAPAESGLFSTRDRKIGFGFVAGGTLVVVIGFALWASEASLQSQIDGASTDTRNDVTRLLALENRAGSYAWEGNIAVIVGLAAAGVGTYYLLRDHEVTVAPIDHNTGAAVTLGGRW
jgi:hypothetical protein